MRPCSSVEMLRRIWMGCSLALFGAVILGYVHLWIEGGFGSKLPAYEFIVVLLSPLVGVIVIGVTLPIALAFGWATAFVLEERQMIPAFLVTWPLVAVVMVFGKLYWGGLEGLLLTFPAALVGIVMSKLFLRGGRRERAAMGGVE